MMAGQGADERAGPGADTHAIAPPHTVFSSLPDDKQKRWLALGDAWAQEGAPKTPGGVLRTNGFDDAEGFANLYELLARINHRCRPIQLRAECCSPFVQAPRRCPSPPHLTPTPFSCEPNAARLSLKHLAGASSSAVLLVAERHISEGEEITIDYLDGAEGMTFDQRRERLRRTHNFELAEPPT